MELPTSSIFKKICLQYTENSNILKLLLKYKY
jgi:hypothetical protein